MGAIASGAASIARRGWHNPTMTDAEDPSQTVPCRVDEKLVLRRRIGKMKRRLSPINILSCVGKAAATVFHLE